MTSTLTPPAALETSALAPEIRENLESQILAHVRGILEEARGCISLLKINISPLRDKSNADEMTEKLSTVEKQLKELTDGDISAIARSAGIRVQEITN